MDSFNNLYQFGQFLFSWEFQASLWPARFIFVIVSLIFLVFIGYTILHTRWFKFVIGYAWVEFFTLRPFGQSKAARQWHKLRQRFIRPLDLPHYRKAIIQAHAILDDYLDDIVIFFNTTSCRARLERLGPETISNIEELRQAEELSSKLIANPTYHLSRDEYLAQLEIYHRAFIGLGIAKD